MSMINQIVVKVEPEYKNLSYVRTYSEQQINQTIPYKLIIETTIDGRPYKTEAYFERDALMSEFEIIYKMIGENILNRLKNDILY